jgi:hypothetical protein
MAIFEGSLLGEGGARNAAGCGFGARLLAGEKCCCNVENVGRLGCDSERKFRVVVGSFVDSWEGGRRAVDAVRMVEEDFVRVCPVTRGTDDVELVETFRKCLD